MAEPVAMRLRPLAAAPLRGGVAIAALPPTGRLVLRGRPDAIAAAAPVLSFDVPTTPCRAAVADGRAALWLGPDEWLLLAPETETEPLLAALTAALAGHSHALVDIGHRQTGIAISGDAAEAVLNAGCPLDLGLAAFPVGQCTRTVFANAEIVLWRTAPDSFQVEIARSFAPYLWHFLEDASREFRE